MMPSMSEPGHASAFTSVPTRQSSLFGQNNNVQHGTDFLQTSSATDVAITLPEEASQSSGNEDCSLRGLTQSASPIGDELLRATAEITSFREVRAPEEMPTGVGGENVSRYALRTKRVPCPMCGKFFFNVTSHAATCEPPKAAPQSMKGTESVVSGGKKKRGRVAGTANVAVPPAKLKRGASVVPANDTSKPVLPVLLPPALAPPVPVSDENQAVIQRERAFLHAAARLADEVLENGVPMQVEFFEADPGIVLMASPQPFRDGMGQGQVFTLRTEILKLVEELHQVRESDSAVRAENEKLRALVTEVQTSGANTLTVETERRENEARAHQDKLKILKEAHSADIIRLQAIWESERKKMECQAKSNESALRDSLMKSESERSQLENDRKETESKIASLEKELLRIKSLADELDNMVLKSRDEVTIAREELRTTKEALAKLKDETTRIKAERDSIQNQLVLKTDEVDELRREFDDQSRHFQSTSLDDNLGMILSGSARPMIIQDTERREYVDLLRQWLGTHGKSMATSALAVFHGTKSRAGELWSILAQSGTLHDVLLGTEGIILSEDGMRIDLIEEINEDPLVEFFAAESATDDLLGLSIEEVSLVERIVGWLEEKNGHATWSEFQETFSGFEGNREDIVRILTLYGSRRPEEEEPMFVVPQTGDLVLSSMADRVLVQLFCVYLREQTGGVAPASKYAHFTETVPGIVFLRSKLAPNDVKLNSLAKKFPDKVHFWREGDIAMCCIADERPRVEREKAERKRLEEQTRMEEERARIDREKQAAEEKARTDWEQRRSKAVVSSSSQDPSSSALHVVTAPVTGSQPKQSRWSESGERNAKVQSGNSAQQFQRQESESSFQGEPQQPAMHQIDPYQGSTSQREGMRPLIQIQTAAAGQRETFLQPSQEQYSKQTFQPQHGQAFPGQPTHSVNQNGSGSAYSGGNPPTGYVRHGQGNMVQNPPPLHHQVQNGGPPGHVHQSQHGPPPTGHTHPGSSLGHMYPGAPPQGQSGPPPAHHQGGSFNQQPLRGSGWANYASAPQRPEPLLPLKPSSDPPPLLAGPTAPPPLLGGGGQGYSRSEGWGTTSSGAAAPQSGPGYYGGPAPQQHQTQRQSTGYFPETNNPSVYGQPPSVYPHQHQHQHPRPLVEYGQPAFSGPPQGPPQFYSTPSIPPPGSSAIPPPLLSSKYSHRERPH